MKFFIDTANLEQIQEAYDLGVLDGVTTNPSLMAKEGIKGELEVYGKIGDEAKICDLQKGKKYLRFSTYSSELNGKEREFTWVKCIRFGEEKEDFVKKGAAIHLTGEIKAEMYKGKISLTCFVKYLSPWQKNNKEG